MHSQCICYHVAERSTKNTANFIILKSTLLHKSSVPIYSSGTGPIKLKHIVHCTHNKRASLVQQTSKEIKLTGNYNQH